MEDNGSATNSESTRLASIETSWQSFLAALDGIPEDRMTEPGAVGEWSVKDVFGHIAFWEGMAIEAVERRVAGEPDRKVDVQALNDAEAEARRDVPLGAARDEMIRTHERLLATARSIVDRDPTLVATVYDSLKDDTYEHYDEHAADIRAWRGRNGL